MASLKEEYSSIIVIVAINSYAILIKKLTREFIITINCTETNHYNRVTTLSLTLTSPIFMIKAENSGIFGPFAIFD